ncbi:MAG: phosphatidate cytidylyltransferase [Clostridiales bacterium]|nr:phosphatidate cytidylyltransferase [Clostridiales bacterium]MDY5350484.1 phosphatidate cytidylyltransferase [Candidatus Ventricola sp.]MDY5515542.1 phosphatidate cytidylyltransferase [Candidatus Ventricola sp.]
MKTRLLTAAIGIPFLIFVLIVRGWFAELLIVALTLIALYECYRALTAAHFDVCRIGGYTAAICMWPLSRFMGVLDPLLLVVAAMGLSMSGVILGKRPSFPNAAASVYPLFTCLLPMSMFMMMMNATYGQVPGIALITMAFAVAFCCDAAAYFGGRAFGKRKLCPMISPKKTVEGAVFGFLGGLLGALVIRWVFIHVFRMAMPGIPATVVLGLLGSFAGQIGDLTASLLKRYSGIKDYGNVFPGHGGVMDRFDSVIFTLIVLYCYTLVL